MTLRLILMHKRMFEVFGSLRKANWKCLDDTVMDCTSSHVVQKPPTASKAWIWLRKSLPKKIWVPKIELFLLLRKWGCLKLQDGPGCCKNSQRDETLFYQTRHPLSDSLKYLSDFLKCKVRKVRLKQLKYTFWGEFGVVLKLQERSGCCKNS